MNVTPTVPLCGRLSLQVPVDDLQPLHPLNFHPAEGIACSRTLLRVPT
jgi:hypothetical protein